MPHSLAPTQTSAQKTKVIYNPAANKGSCGKAWPLIKAELAAVLGAVDAEATAGPGDGARIARAAFEDGCRRFVAVGGDGTLNEVVNGLVVEDRLRDPAVTFAQIPAGTSNAISLALGHPGRGTLAPRAFAALSGTATRPIDLFRTDCFDSDGRPAVRYGCLLAMLGAPATVSLRAAAIPLLKRLGPVAYVIVSAATALTYRPRQASIVVDGSAPREVTLWGALLCSSPTAGDGLLLAPGALLDDGRVDLLEIGALTRREALLEIIPKLADGSYCGHRKVARSLVREVAIATREPIPVDVDGEPAGFSPFEFRVMPESLRMAVAGA